MRGAVNSIQELARNLGLVEPRRYIVDWDRAERDVGVRFPSDYKEYVYWFGPGGFEDSFFVSIPGVENSNVELLSNFRDEVEDLRSWNSGDRGPAIIKLFPESGGWLPFAVSVEGCGIFWITEGGDPNCWPVAARTRFWEPEYFRGGFAEFLCAAVYGAVEFEALPELEHDPPLEFWPDDGSWLGGAGTRLDGYGFFEVT
ncbi:MULTISPECIES: SMI1/KNR4 family protein [unclassified Streptomyces]|uniref:SMI1/KNR4 family protein n=1 Tax=unclassified Streptomyces TaxID=2593676 RepID=UPI0022B73036|nr:MULTISPECIES: SMI1/KNR4 family protein [unclassified Streptomyces]MCZ7417227.1 SMI1/KNR4 family protein [Streptomyces sp. WMMC897]MCZ7432945.1 SMI1/KNR4 family protein [Streptomyces sp. WMMC1477]